MGLPADAGLAVASIVGFAFSALAGAALLRVVNDPVQAVAVMVACSIAIQAYSVWSLRESIDWRALLPFLAGGAATVPLGIWLLTTLSARAFSVALGAIVVGYAAYLLCSARPPAVSAGPKRRAAVGALSGVVGGFAGFPGLFVTIWCGMERLTKEKQRAIYQPFILCMQIEALGALRVAVPSSVSLRAVALYVPVALLAAYLGLEVFRKMTQRQFNLMVYVLLMVSGGSLLASGL